MDDFFGDMIDLRGPKSVGCAECAKEGKEIQLEIEERYNRALAAYIEVYVCPECGNEKLASDEVRTVDGERF